MTVINHLGENNHYRNAVLNCIQVLKDNMPRIGRKMKEYYEEDILNPICPSMAVIVENSEDEMRSTQAFVHVRYTIDIGLQVWYYHEDLTEETKRNEITYILWEINKLLKENITLNGFVPHMGLEVRGARWSPRIRGDRMLAGGVIILVAHKLHTTSTS